MRMNFLKRSEKLIGRDPFLRVILAWSVIIVILLVFGRPVSAFDFDDAITAFERDTGRTSPLDMLERYRFFIRQVSGLEPASDVKIIFKTPGEFQAEVFKKMLDNSMDFNEPEKNLEGYEYFLKRFGLVEEGVDLEDFFLKRYVKEVAGFYVSENNELVVMKGSDRKSMAETLFHELFHAAQDNTVDLHRLRKEYGKNFDETLALNSLIEGQAVMANLLVTVKQSIGSDSVESIFRKSVESFEENMKKTLPSLNYFEFVSMSPYTYGYSFVVNNYIKGGMKDFQSMFKRPPVSTEQVLHYEKYIANEKPVHTVLERKKGVIKPEWDVLLSTSLGEFQVYGVMNGIIPDRSALNKQAASGWGGDWVGVYRTERGKLFVWDTLWDSEKDAREFFKRYKSISMTRFKTSKLYKTKSFDIVYPKIERDLFIKSKGKRVLVIEGDVTDRMARFIVNHLEFTND